MPAEASRDMLEFWCKAKSKKILVDGRLWIQTQRTLQPVLHPDKNEEMHVAAQPQAKKISMYVRIKYIPTVPAGRQKLIAAQRPRLSLA
jgi:hypothetical protein